ncbi:MAG: SPOR domain-containing protein [Candidatus Omnitrophica bacterium]|nr:SPOR domain-containing protein [Candidatus Omnitrophota bacterium]
MEEEKYQKELFEFDQPRKSFSIITDMLPKPNLEGNVSVTLTLEKIIFICIGIVMMMVIVYALGVDNGKSRAQATAPAVKQVPAPPLAAVLQPKNTAVTANNILNTAPVAPSARPAQPAKIFTILTGAYNKRESAQAAAAVLNKQGFSASVAYSKPYYIVCVGAYSDKNGADAKNDLSRVRRTYKDAYFKLI